MLARSSILMRWLPALVLLGSVVSPAIARSQIEKENAYVSDYIRDFGDVFKIAEREKINDICSGLLADKNLWVVVITIDRLLPAITMLSIRKFLKNFQLHNTRS